MSGWQSEPSADKTYAPDATECSKGHRFASEADCVLPEDWDQFMCRACIAESAAAKGACSHDWQPYWDGSLGYSATDRCTPCGDYRPTPQSTEADTAP